MPREIVTTSRAPSSPFYSQAVVAGSLVLVSGTTGIDVSTGQQAGASIQDQTRQELASCEAILDDVVEVGVLLANPDDFGGMNEEYAT